MEIISDKYTLKTKFSSENYGINISDIPEVTRAFTLVIDGVEIIKESGHGNGVIKFKLFSSTENDCIDISGTDSYIIWDFASYCSPGYAKRYIITFPKAAKRERLCASYFIAYQNNWNILDINKDKDCTFLRYEYDQDLKSLLNKINTEAIQKIIGTTGVQLLECEREKEY